MPGHYFITICTQNRVSYFGKVIDGKMVLNKIGKIVFNYWIKIPRIYENIELGEHIIMPNHIHGIIIIGSVGTEHCSVPTKTKHNKMGFLSQTIKFYKEAVTKEIKGKKCKFKWQRSFYDRVIRDNDELSRIRDYIIANPINWFHDRNNPFNIK